MPRHLLPGAVIYVIMKPRRGGRYPPRSHDQWNPTTVRSRNRR